MLDSGASCNFISSRLFQTLDLGKYVVANTSSVRLANGGIVSTVGKVDLRVQFGQFEYFGPFYILECEVPLILGMSFFAKMRPHVDWVERKVYIETHGTRLHVQTVSIGKKEQKISSASSQFVNIQDHNSFDGLDVDYEESSDVAQDSCLPNISAQQQPMHGKVQCKVVCKGCSRVLPCGSAIHVCKKCQNHSFLHLQYDPVFRQGQNFACRDEIPISNFCGTSSTSGVTKNSNNVEIVPLKQFIRGGKHNMYLNFGMVQLHDFEDDLKQQQLNFTHRTSHGGDGDKSSLHGSYEKLAVQQLDELKQKYPVVFSEPTYPVDRSDCPVIFEHRIPLVDENAPPPKRKLYPLDSVELVELKKQIADFLESNRIEPSNGAYGAPILFAKKKDGGLRMCIDYRMLNAQTKSDVFPIPRIDELLQRLDGAVVFSKLDLRDGYHQIPMFVGDRQKTAFTCRYGTYQFTVMPFGLSSAPSTFQRMMNRVFFELLDDGVLCYLDDLLIYSKSIEQHKIVLDKVFALLAKYKLFIKESKCHLFLEKVNFLGHVVSADGVSLEQGKVDAVEKWPQPQNVNQIQQFLGLCNYYRRFVLRFSEIAGPLTLLTRKDQPFVFGIDQVKAFEKLKASLCNAPTLRVFDPTLQTRVVCDASNFCVGAVLEQLYDGKWHPVEYYSKRLSSAERNYSATDREFVAIKLALERWRHFLIGQHFVLLTDHAALTYLHTTATVSRRNARWLDFLSQFDFEIFHIKGKENVVADSLSRIPGSEVLEALQLCSMECTLGISHVKDVPVKLLNTIPKNSTQLQCHSVLTIHENQSFLQQIRDEQLASQHVWFIDKCNLARSGSSIWQYRDGILCKLVADVFCPVIPTSDSRSVQVILHDLHSGALSGHFGLKKMLKAAQKRFFWQQMYITIERFCRQCSVCQSNKPSTQHPIGRLQPVENPVAPFEHVTMDFIMPLPVSDKGYDAIFTVVDRFSRFVKFIPCHSTCTAADVADIFFQHWVCVFGMPSKIISDRDVRFQSKFWQSLMAQLDCRVAMSTAYHPQTDGLSERFHRTLEQVLRCYCSSKQSSWCTYLAQCNFAINSTVQDAIGTSPFRCIYGLDPVIPLDKQLQQLQSPAVVDFVSTRLSTHEQVQSSLQASQERMRQSADRKRRHEEFIVGQKVWLSTAHLPLREGARKLAARWAGPYTVSAIIAPTAYRLALPGHWKIHDVFHVSQLKASQGSPKRPEPLQIDSQGNQEFEVSDILDMRLTRGSRYFLIRWKGYDSFEDTWEPEENLANCKALMKRFLEQRASLG